MVALKKVTLIFFFGLCPWLDAHRTPTSILTTVEYRRLLMHFAHALENKVHMCTVQNLTPAQCTRAHLTDLGTRIITEK